MEGLIEEFPVWGLLPKKETGVSSFISKFPEYNGKDVTIAIFDSGVDPGAPGLKETPDGKVKIVERFDCSGCGDVVMSTNLQPINGCITGLTRRKLKIPTTWKNPSNNYRIGIKNAFDLYPDRLRERIQEETKEKFWDNEHKIALAEVTRRLTAFESKGSNTQLNEEDKLNKENLEAQVEYLVACDIKYADLGPYYDCILFHDGDKWVACIDVSEKGDLENCPLLGEYSITHDFAPLNESDQLNFSINVHNGNILELVGLCSNHGTHVASIASAYFPEEPEKNGVAPGAQIISLTIGDGRLGSMETGTSMVRAMIKIMELQKQGRKVDVINMSYGEHAHWSNAGRIGDIMNEIVNKYGVVWVASAGNSGPALSTVSTPPDISQETIIGVGAYVSPDMMVAEYAMQTKLPGMAYTWSSRGPTIDGALGVTVCAPGGAITSVPNCTLRNSQLMNGTSMASPHVAGAVGVLISGLKAEKVEYSPYNIKRALENGAKFLPDLEVFSQGNGLLNVESSFNILTTYSEVQERDVRFQISCGPNNCKGIYIRNKTLTSTHDVLVHVEPFFIDNDTVSASRKINFNLRLALVCKDTYVQYPKHLHLSNMPRFFGIKIDTSGLKNVNFTSIDAYDVTCVQKGPIFKIPITVIKPIEIVPPQYSIFEKEINFQDNTIKRIFVNVPELATWAVIRMRSCEMDKIGKFNIHCMHILSKKSCKTLELNKHFTVTSNVESSMGFQVRGLTTLEVVIAKYWAHIGKINVNYSISFFGIKPNQNNITMMAVDGIHQVEVSTLQGEEILPCVTLKNSVQILRPTDSKVNALTARDIIPPGRQIYELILNYPFHLHKATEVSPNCPILSDTLYESEYESQLWMLFDSNKQYLGGGDAYPSKYILKLEKGDYFIKLQVRHEKKDYLEKLTETTLLLSQKLSIAVALDVYSNYSQALTNGKKATVGKSLNISTVPLYIAPLLTDKFPVKANNEVDYLTGTISYAKDEFGKRVDVYGIKYIIKKCIKKPTKAPEKTKTKAEEFNESLREFKVNWLAKLDSTSGAEDLYNEMVKDLPDFYPTYSAYLQSLDPMDAKKQVPLLTKEDILAQNREEIKRIIEICDKPLENINQDVVLMNSSIKIDLRPDAAQIKQTMDRQKSVLIDCLSRKGIALCRLYLIGSEEGNNKVEKCQISKIWKNVLQFVDPIDSKYFQANVAYFAAWHATVFNHYGRLIKYLQRLHEEKPSKELEEKLIEIYEIQNWNHLVKYSNRQIISKYPISYRPF